MIGHDIAIRFSSLRFRFPLQKIHNWSREISRLSTETKLSSNITSNSVMLLIVLVSAVTPLVWKPNVQTLLSSFHTSLQMSFPFVMQRMKPFKDIIELNYKHEFRWWSGVDLGRRLILALIYNLSPTTPARRVSVLRYNLLLNRSLVRVESSLSISFALMKKEKAVYGQPSWKNTCMQRKFINCSEKERKYQKPLFKWTEWYVALRQNWVNEDRWADVSDVSVCVPPQQGRKSDLL